MRILSAAFASALVLTACSTTESISTLQTRAAQGDPEAGVQLGHRYFSGEGVPRNYAEGIRLWTKAAERGNAEAQWLLGGCYEIGYDEPKNPAKAASWWRKAAAQGYAKAQCDLGNCYHYGRGVPKNISTAYAWYSLAADGGSTQGRTHRDTLAAGMSPAALAAAKAEASRLAGRLR
jgi:TPR repeat protein